jgi:hypothetical protein
MANTNPPEPPNAPTVIFETEPTITGYRLRGTAFHTPGGGIAVALFRRMLLGPVDPKGDHVQQWFIVSELAVYPPMAFSEVLHTYTTWLNSYDPNLKDALGPLQDHLAKLHESAQPPNAPRGLMN